jgi:hypothetical protein
LGWHGISLVAIASAYSLIDMQFAFRKKIRAFGILDSRLKMIMTTLARLKPNLDTTQMEAANSIQRKQRFMPLARVVKFGLHGRAMPGHEYLSDRDVSSLVLWLTRNGQPRQTTPNYTLTPGEGQ